MGAYLPTISQVGLNFYQPLTTTLPQQLSTPNSQRRSGVLGVGPTNAPCNVRDRAEPCKTCACVSPPRPPAEPHGADEAPPAPPAPWPCRRAKRRERAAYSTG